MHEIAQIFTIPSDELDKGRWADARWALGTLTQLTMPGPTLPRSDPTLLEPD